MDRLKDAIMLAVTKHNDQLDKAGQLYITHPLRVMDRFLGAPIEYQISAVLHDVIEDTDTTYEDLKEKFGVEVADIVNSLSRTQEETYVEFIRRVAKHRKARLIKLADIQDNLNPRRTLIEGLKPRYIKAYDTIIQAIVEEEDEDELLFIDDLGLLLDIEEML